MEIAAILTIADKILILILLAFSIVSYFYLYSRTEANEAEIIFRGNRIGRYNLHTEKVIPLDEGITVEIKNGKARLAEDTSPRQIGVKQGWSNQIPIISVPSELIIKFPAKEEEMLITY